MVQNQSDLILKLILGILILNQNSGELEFWTECTERIVALVTHYTEHAIAYGSTWNVIWMSQHAYN